MSFNWNPLDDAEIHKAVAMDRRNRGKPSGKPAAGWNWKRREPAPGTVDRLLSEIKCKWEWTRSEALEDYRFAVYPERYEPLDDCPF